MRQSVQRRLKVGHTAITWEEGNIEEGIRTIWENGYHAIEVFSWTLNDLRKNNRLSVFEQYNVPLVSSYFSVDIANPSARDSELKKLTDWGELVKSLGGRYATLGGNPVDRKLFNFSDHESYIVETVNEMGRCLADVGIELNFHPHTGTPVETEEEIRRFLDRVDKNIVGFAPDVGQIQKGGADPVQLLSDYFELIRLVHLKDFGGTVAFNEDGTEIDSTGFLCYTPLGDGVVDIPSIINMLESSQFNGYIMVELDPGEKMPMSAAAAVARNRAYLETLGYTFVRRT